MNDPRVNDLLKWSIENSEASRKDPNAPKPKTKFNPSILEQMLGGAAPPSDAETMKNRMAMVTSADTTIEQKRRALEDFETLVQGIDNANNIEALRLWTPLVEQLEHKDAGVRMWAAWSVGTAVENNVKAQKRLLVVGGIPTLVKLATEDPDMTVRKKAIRALSGVSRNFQPGLDAVVAHVPASFKPQGSLNAGDMSAVDSVIQPLRENAQRA
ncbi:Hsp70 nucleotide exchange factor FES1 [Lentithecium fluviatile CBS 122367]|uniref:Hsp70 nucleotide exchange factor FES1 n=1 Tax=Lentithecium fluviatile CBS 122367 TaxID=1168545 RepID=A0A6G1JD62_9PLEO|nr:Hsp70 nucleotide exchange factor FES1 [Lentithecium fluviatile CBS 122367]